MVGKRFDSDHSLECKDINKVRNSRTKTLFSKGNELYRLALHNQEITRVAIVVEVNGKSDVFLSSQDREEFPIDFKRILNARIRTSQDFTIGPEAMRDREILSRLHGSEIANQLRLERRETTDTTASSTTDLQREEDDTPSQLAESVEVLSPEAPKAVGLSRATEDFAVQSIEVIDLENDNALPVARGLSCLRGHGLEDDHQPSAEESASAFQSAILRTQSPQAISPLADTFLAVPGERETESTLPPSTLPHFVPSLEASVSVSSQRFPWGTLPRPPRPGKITQVSMTNVPGMSTRVSRRVADKNKKRAQWKGRIYSDI